MRGRRGKEEGRGRKGREREGRREGKGEEREGGKGGGKEGSGETFLYPAEHQSSYYYILQSAPAYPLKNVARDGEVFMCCAAATREFVLVRKE